MFADLIEQIESEMADNLRDQARILSSAPRDDYGQAVLTSLGECTLVSLQNDMRLLVRELEHYRKMSACGLMRRQAA